MWLYTFISLFLFTEVSCQTFHFSGNPYSSRTDLSRQVNDRHINAKSLNDTKPEDFQPFMDSHYLWPEQSGTYPVLFFYAGLYAELPEMIYTDLLENIAKKGFCVTTSWPGRDPINFSLWKQQFDWNVENFDQIIYQTELNENSRSPNTVTCDFSNIAVYSHSSASEILKSLALDDSYVNRISAYYFNDPVMAGQNSTSASVILVVFV